MTREGAAGMARPFVRRPDDDLVDRTTVFAALADPTRLAIVESLLLTDLAPQDIVDALDIRSNLLAHHLNVLESAGILRRSPSEGDGRRRYLRLERSLPTPLVLRPSPLDADRVLFVCTRHLGVSQIAARLWAMRSSVPAAAASHEPATVLEAAAEAAAERGLGPLDAEPVAVVDLSPLDGVVVTLSDIARERADLGLADGAVLLHWSIPPPTDRHDVERAIGIISRRIDVLHVALGGDPPD